MTELIESALDEIVEERKDYSQDERDQMAKEGLALPDGSYPIKTRADLANAIQALGRGSNNPKSEIKAHIVKRAKALDATDLLPEDWRSAELRDVEVEIEVGDEECPTCEGTGKVDGEDCPDCEGTGMLERKADPDLERRKRVAASIEGTFERRDFTASDIEIRSTSDGGLRFTGYASTTETPYDVADFTETISRGAFKRTLGQDPDVVMLINHEGLPLARTKSKTMTLTEDTRGLRVDADLDPTDPDVRSLLPKMKRGDLTEMSFAFRATQQDWDEEYTQRTIREVVIDKGDVSMVTHGANTATTGTVTMRSEDGELELRVGKAISGAKEQKLKDAKEAIEEVLGQPDEAEPTLPADPLAIIIPSGVEAARAAKARMERRSA